MIGRSYVLRLPLLLVAAVAGGCAGAHPPERHPAPATTAPAGDEDEPLAESAATSAGAGGSPNDELTEEPDLIEDEAEDTAVAEGAAQLSTRAHPLDGWSAERIRDVARDNLAALGSMSIGQPNSGALLNGKRAEKCELFEPVDTPHAFGTEETLAYLATAIRKVHAEFPGTPTLALGDISAARGGAIRPHISHQAGRDVDISYYYTDGTRWYARATEKNLDLPRTWAFVRALVTDTDVDMILIDHSIQLWLRRYAIEHGEDREWVESLFAGSSRGQRPIVRHAPGHATHIHVRFFNPIAQETARRAASALSGSGVIPQLVQYVSHRAKRGDTLAKIAKKYKVSVAAIRSANGLRSSRIRERRDYRIPLRAARVAPPSAPLRFPARRLPPTSPTAASQPQSLAEH